ncbi:MAG: hypothetical protein IAF58_05895 [Leptolyngbya sp.]|nr:hypothetical protein [Candidatus Melainabacteria bacterium]
MTSTKIDKAYLELINQFPLIPLREGSHFEDAIRVMKKLAYRIDDLSQGEADYLSVLSDLILKYEKRLPGIELEDEHQLIQDEEKHRAELMDELVALTEEMGGYKSQQISNGLVEITSDDDAAGLTFREKP